MRPSLSAPLSLRPAEDGDVAQLEAIYASTRVEELDRTDWTDEQKDAFIHMQFRAQDSHYRQHYPGAERLLLCRAQATIGRLYLHDRGDEIRIMDLALLPDFRNQGIGTCVLHSLQNEAAVNGKRLSIHVERFNPARHLYARLGFTLKSEGEVYNLLQWSPAIATVTRTLENEHV